MENDKRKSDEEWKIIFKKFSISGLKKDLEKSTEVFYPVVKGYEKNADEIVKAFKKKYNRELSYEFREKLCYFKYADEKNIETKVISLKEYKANKLTQWIINNEKSW